MNRAPLQNISRDLALVSAAFLLSIALGFFVNLFRSDPLSFPYRVRSARMLAGVPGTGKEPHAITLAGAEAAWRKGAAVFVDARESFFFEEGHIPRAINLPASKITGKKLPALPADPAANVIVYCSGGDCEDSGIVARALLAAGCQNVAILSGGWDAWSAAKISQ